MPDFVAASPPLPPDVIVVFGRLVTQNEISAGGGIVMRTSRFALAYFHYVFKSTMVDFSEELVGHIPTIRNKRNDFLRVYWETNVRHFSIYF